MKISEAAEQGIISFKLKKPIMYWGSPGIGKSAMVQQIRELLRINLIDQRFSQMDPTDVRGLPMTLQEGTDWWTRYAIPGFLPRIDRDGEHGILFLDEFNQAPQAVQAAGHQLILDRRLGDYVLPEGWMVMAAGNKMDDRAQAIRMSTSLSNRFKNVDVDVDVDEWKLWARSNHQDPVIIALMNSDSKLLHDMSTKTAAWASPRTWELLSDHVTQGFITKDNEYHTAASCVGQGAAGIYIAFRQLEDQVPSPEEIRAHPMTARIPTEPSAKFFVSGMLSTQVNEDSFPAYLKYQQRLDIEYQTVFMRDAYQVCPDVADLKEYSEWALANHNTVL
jgi:hypothetical protein